MAQRPSLEDARVIAERLLGYPCSCEHCSKDGGWSKSIAIESLAHDLAGLPETAILASGGSLPEHLQHYLDNSKG
jgi:hypothetical protein